MTASPPSAAMIDVATARALALALVAPIQDRQRVPLSEALGRAVAQDVIAPMAMPFFTNSGMDGFALCVADLHGSGPYRLPIAATIAAGANPAQGLPRGAAVRIFTGAPVPAGADAVIALEDARETDGDLVLDFLPPKGAHLRLAGSDQAAGACLLPRGTRIAPHHIGLLAANGLGLVEVLRRPRVAVLSTGDELGSCGDLAPGQIHDANRPMLLALVAAAGGVALDAGSMPDDPAALADRLAELAADADLILSSGGVSMGGRDPLRPAFVAAGGKIDGWRVAVKPGKPVMFGRLGKAGFIGLPGNPMAAFVGFHLFAAAQMAVLAGMAAPTFAAHSARAAFAWQRRTGRLEVFPVRNLGAGSCGLPQLQRLGSGVSASLFPLTAADGLAIVPADLAEVTPGLLLQWQPFCLGW